MATQNPMRRLLPKSHSSKRKFPGDESGSTIHKKLRAANASSENRAQNHTPSHPASGASHYSQIYSPLLSQLGTKFEVKTMTVLPSTSIRKHVDRALDHLSRFNAWDPVVAPGVVLLCAKAGTSSKLITIAELVRRRIGESEQKWFQYNVPREVAVMVEPAPAMGDTSVVEDTVLGREKEEADDEGNGDQEEDDDDYFETLQPTIHEQAAQPAQVKHVAHTLILLSRIPLDELKSEPNVSVQTNEGKIEFLRKKKMG
ncbi:uncharacterized protein C8A04DRAFT_30331 [Dichotomopilus funicola]|uniref:DNA/RNA-binding protein Alba-like domain-containing protein n=1 Tax=Dichotomopilus funicola TaxID=1934379 RepID=A0AAN6ZLA4_9PEZI|nr:hypothetical protein C8A04DRAFT_30331 [Dichotomopilus funicola]